MNPGITGKLFLVFLAAAGLTAVSMFAIMQWSLDRGFLRFVTGLEQARLARLAERLETAYAGEGSWEQVHRDPARWRRMIISSQFDEGADPVERDDHEPGPGAPPHPGEPGPERRPLPPPLTRGFLHRVVLLDSSRSPLIGPHQATEVLDLKPLRNDGRVVGYLGLLPRAALSDERQLRFLKEQKLALLLAVGVVVLIAAGLSFPLARRLVRPVRLLASGTNRLAAGEYAVRVPVASSDEIGQLSRDFNMLATTLERNEQARRRWIADISHELRTPLAVLRGEIEALQDGVRPLTADSVNSLHADVLTLGRLVADLYQLSLSDLGALNYRKENLDLGVLLETAFAPYRTAGGARGIAMTFESDGGPTFPVFGDAGRLHQLFANLLDNAVKYTNCGGRIEVRLCRSGGLVTVDLQDSPPGVPANELEKLFEPLYRLEASRSRAAGGAGLGLAICRNIVEAHEGNISAHPSPLGGLRVRIELPLREDRA